MPIVLNCKNASLFFFVFFVLLRFAVLGGISEYTHLFVIAKKMKTKLRERCVHGEENVCRDKKKRERDNTTLFAIRFHTGGGKINEQQKGGKKCHGNMSSQHTSERNAVDT